MPKLMVVIVLFLAATFVIFSFSELQDISQTLRQARPEYIGLALLVQCAWLLVTGWTFQSIYALLGLEETRERLTLLAAAATFIGTVTTSAAVGGLAVFIADGRRHGHPSAKVTVAGVLYLLVDEAAFLCVLALGFIVLIRRNHLGVGEISAALILLAVASALAAFLYLAYRSPEVLGRTLGGIARAVNGVLRPFIRREYLSEGRARAFAAEMAAGIGSLPEKPRSLIKPFLLSLANKVLLMTVLICNFLSFDVSFSLGTIVGSFAISHLFVIVSPTPSGVGMVEGIMALALRTLGVDFGQAVVVTLAYRGVTFWLPLAMGAVALRLLHLKRVRTTGLETIGPE